jgi:hypothetical protein
VLLLAWTAIGHYHRPSIEAQTATWFDGRKEYRFERSEQDTFDPEFYRNTRSIEEAVQFIQARYQPETEDEKLRAVYDFTRKRFMHFMYPHHTWRTNPYLALAEVIAPTRSWNQMALADDKLRHSAVASCGHAANVFVEIYRAVGGKAQKVSFSGHDIAEARIGERRYFVDANLERFMQGRVSDVVQSESRLRALYSGYAEERISHFVDVFQTDAKFWGYDGPSFNSPRIQWVQSLVAWVKWLIPVLLLGAGIGLLVLGRRRV